MEIKADKQFFKLPAGTGQSFRIERAVPTGKLAPEEREKKLKKAGESFESYFVYTLLKSMQKGVAGMSGDLGQGTFNEMFDQKIAEKIAERGGIGIGKVIEEDVRAKVLNKQELEHGAPRFMPLPGAHSHVSFPLKKEPSR